MAYNPLLAAEYRRRAAAERAAGEATGLEQVRAKHEEAARVWTGLADAEDARHAESLARQRQSGAGAG
jgi:hypothetical protein